MALEIHGLDLRLAKKMLFTGVNLRIDKPNLVVYVLDENGLAVVGADVNITSTGHNLDSVTDSEGTALTRFMPAINNTLTVSKDGYVTSTQIIFNETPSTLSVYVQLFASEIRLKVVNNQNEPIEGATCRVLNAVGGSNNVLSFDGVDDKTEMGDVFDLRTGSRSYEFWMYAQRKTGVAGILGKTRAAGSTGRWAFLFENNNCIAILHMPSGTRNVSFSTSNINLNTWQHVAISIDRGSNMKVYLDGNLMGTSASISGDAASDINTTDIFGIGGYQNTTGTAITQYFFQGKLSEIRVWNTVRSQQNFLDNMNKRLVGNESGLIGYYPLSEGTGSTASDSAGSNNGTIYGATWQEADESFPLFSSGIQGYDPTPYDSQTTNANGLCTLNYQINQIHGLEVTLPGKRRFIMPFERTTRGLLDWQVMLSDYLATFATDKGNILINSEPENNDANFLIE